MKQPALPFILFLVLQCARLGVPLAVPSPFASSALPEEHSIVERSVFGDFGGDFAHDGEKPGGGGGGTDNPMTGSGKQWAKEHPNDVGKEDTAGGVKGDTKGNAIVDSGKKAADGNAIATDGNEIVEINGVKAEMNKATNEYDLEVPKCKFKRRRNVFEIRNKDSICFPDLVPEVIDFNRAFKPLDQATSKTLTAQVKWVHSEIGRKLKLVTNDDIGKLLDGGNIKITKLNGQPRSPEFLASANKVPKNSILLTNMDPDMSFSDVSPLGGKPADNTFSGTPVTFGKIPEPVSPGSASPLVFKGSAESPFNVLSSSNLQGLYDQQIADVLKNPDFGIAEQIKVQAKWQKLLNIRDPSAAVAVKTETVNIEQAIKAMEKSTAAKKELNPMFREPVIWIDSITYDFNLPDQIPDSFWKEQGHDEEAVFDSPEGKAYQKEWKNYVKRQKDYASSGSEAETVIETRAGLPKGTLKSYFSKLAEGTDPEATNAMTDILNQKGIRIKVSGNKITIGGLPLTTVEKVGLPLYGIGAGGLLVYGAVECSMNDCPFSVN